MKRKKPGPKPKKFCKHGHDTSICGRDKSNCCRKCRALISKKWAKENPKRRCEWSKEWAKAHPEYIKEHNHEYQMNNKEKIKIQKRGYILKNKYGITIEDYDKMFKQQKGKCAICKRSKPESEKYFDIDHDHKTGEVRALLCTKCNLLLGMVHDDVKFLKTLIQYLKKHTKLIKTTKEKY